MEGYRAGEKTLQTPTYLETYPVVPFARQFDLRDAVEELVGFDVLGQVQ